MRQRAFWFWAYLGPVLLALVLLSGCATLIPGPLKHEIPASKTLPLDGVWSYATKNAEFRFDRGRAYVHADFGNRFRPGLVVIRNIRQTGPRNYSCETLIYKGSRYAWGPSDIHVTSEGELRQTSQPYHDGFFDFKGDVTSFTKVSLDNARWFDLQQNSSRIIAHHELASPPPVTALSPIPTPVPISAPASIPSSGIDPGGAGIINFGRYHALVIGNNAYAHLPQLETAINDARSVASLLQDSYRFRVQLLENGTCDDLMTALARYRRSLTPEDNLLIYYAGHGWNDRTAGEAYWLPIGARRHDETHWISNATITTSLRAIQARHVLVVADSCYSGTLTRGAHMGIRTADYYARLASHRSRTAITSDSNEPVADSGKGGHSVFANAFIRALRDNRSIVDATGLFSAIRRPVMLHADQTPQFGDIRKAGHEDGEFIFVRQVQ